MLFERPNAGPLTTEQLMRAAPSVFADRPHDSRGERYQFISTAAVLDGLRHEGFLPVAATQTRCRLEDKRPFTKHMLRFRHPDAMQLRQVGQEVPEIVLVNSHDGTSSYQIMGGVFRLVCSNGMIVGDTKYDVKVRHSGKVVDDVIEGSFRVIDEMKELVGSLDTLKSIPLSQPEQILLADAAHALRWEPGEHAPVEPEQLLRIRRPQDRNNDLWTSFNRVQENLIKGGLHGHTEKGKNTTTRAVAGVSENVKLNRALWMITQHFAELKAAI